MPRKGNPNEAPARRVPPSGASITPGESDLQLIEARRARRLAEIRPDLVVREARRSVLAEVPPHASAELISECVGGLGRLIGRADLAIPRVPPASDLDLPAGNVRIDEGPAD